MNKAIFLDRDGVVNELIYETDGRIMSPCLPEQVIFCKKSKEGLQLMKSLGFKLVVVTNQPGIAKGFLSWENLEKIHRKIQQETEIDAFFTCPHLPEISGSCGCRKPLPGLLYEAQEKFNICLAHSYLVGDNLSDIRCGNDAGVKKTFRIGTLRADILELQHAKGIFPDFTCQNLLDVALEILRLEAE